MFLELTEALIDGLHGLTLLQALRGREGSWAERASGKGGLLGSERLGLILIICGTKGKLPNLSVLLCYKIKEGRERGGKDEVGEEGGQMDCRHSAG